MPPRSPASLHDRAAGSDADRHRAAGGQRRSADLRLAADPRCQVPLGGTKQSTAQAERHRIPRPSGFSRINTRSAGMSITWTPIRTRQRSPAIQAESTGRQSATLQQLWSVPGTLSERYQIPIGLFGSAPSGGAAAIGIGNAMVASKIKTRLITPDRCNRRAAT